MIGTGVEDSFHIRLRCGLEDVSERVDVRADDVGPGLLRGRIGGQMDHHVRAVKRIAPARLPTAEVRCQDRIVAARVAIEQTEGIPRLPVAAQLAPMLPAAPVITIVGLSLIRIRLRRSSSMLAAAVELNNWHRLCSTRREGCALLLRAARQRANMK